MSYIKPKLVGKNSLREKLETLWDRGMPCGFSTGWKSVDRHYTVAPGQITVLTGWPGSGKSEWLDAMLVNLSRQGWKFAVFSPENRPVEVHGAKYLEKITGQPFGAGPTDRIRREEIGELADTLTESFGLLDVPGGDCVSPEAVIDAAGNWFNAYPSEHAGLVIDPWNELEHSRPNNLSETEYVSKTLSMIRNWARESNVHVWIVAHPRNVRREDGKLPVPRPDMISGSQHWWNKADCAVAVWRDMENQDSQDVDIYVQKVRFKHIGRPGLISLKYDRITGRYFEPPHEWKSLTRVV